MKLMLFKEMALKAWRWCREYWQLLLGVAITVAGWLIFRRRPADAGELLGEANRSHRRELEAIDEAEQKEREAVEAARIRRDEAVAQIEQDYSAAQVELDETKRAAIRDIVERHSEDPEALTDELSRLTGARVWTGGKK
jgi:uncharacterized membrane protein